MTTDITWTCACCGKIKTGLPALAFTTPGHFPPLKIWQRLRLGGKANDLYIDRKSGDRFVRCVLRIPIIGHTETLEWGVWCTLSPANFTRYRRSFYSRTQSELGDMFGWFSSVLPGYPETFGLKARVRPQNERQRPLVELEPTDHPLAVDQREGITQARAVELAQPWLNMMQH